MLRTGTGLRRSYTRAQVAKILHVTIAQEGRLEHQAVTGLGKASVGSRCASPARSLQRAVSLTMRAVTNFIHGFSSPSAAPASAPVSAAPKAAPKSSHARPKHAAAPPKTTSPGTAARPRSAAIVSPDHGGLSWLMLALMIAAGTAALMLILGYRRQQPETSAPEGSARPLASAPAPSRSRSRGCSRSFAIPASARTTATRQAHQPDPRPAGAGRPTRPAHRANGATAAAGNATAERPATRRRPRLRGRRRARRVRARCGALTDVGPVGGGSRLPPR